MKHENINAYWGFVKEQYPDARFDFWYHHGELLFFRDGKAEEEGTEPYSCFRKDGKLVIVTEF